jgi:murein DD-endopeptidase MepM/ murein hydrolase activator NlpD
MPSPTLVSLPGSPAIVEQAPLRQPLVAWGGGAAGPAQEPPVARGSGAAGATPEFIMPFERGRVTSMFHQGRYHPAIDLAGPLGTPVRSTTKRQMVVFTGWRGGYGNTVMTRDDRGRTHLYGHLLSVGTRVGRMLDQGQTLGALGSTGHSTGPHVHYEVRASSGGHINPVTLLFPGRSIGRGYAWTSPTPPAIAERSVVAGYPRPR